MSSFFLQAQETSTQNESPYFLVKSGSGEVEDFPLLATIADVTIAGNVADVTVTQRYKNDGKEPIEAIYVFPASTRAAVYAMTMRIGDRIIEAEIHEKNKARTTYEKAKKEGKRASLLEQHRPNVFQMNVANILPSDEIEVILKYNEFLVPESQVYTFVYPTVVGPRYASDTNKGQNESYVSNPYLKNGTKNQSVFDIKVDVISPFPIKETLATSHNVDIEFQSKNKCFVRLEEEDKKRGNKDFILQYKLSDDVIQSGALLYEHQDENFFLTMIEPPRNIPESEILPREYVFVLDVSGSMRGFPMDVSKELMTNLISKLKPSDKFNVMLFAASSQVLSSISMNANKKNLETAKSFIDNARGGGGTELLPALEKAIALPQSLKNNSRSIVVVTDGYVSVEKETFEVISKNLGNSNLFSFGIGSSVNRYIIEGMAHMGRGEAFICTDKSEAKKAAKKLRKYMDRPSLTNINLRFDGIEAYDIIPKSIPDLMAERPIYVFGKYKGKADGKVVITGELANRRFVKSIPMTSYEVDDKNSAIRYLWAREKIRWNHDFNKIHQDKERIKEITELGLKYNLLTDYTSFVAVDHEKVVNGHGKIKSVKQPLPLPENVSNYAVGCAMNKDETISDGKKTKEAVVFVSIKGKMDLRTKKDLDLTFSKLFIKSDRSEKRTMAMNELLITYDQTKKAWTLKDAKNKLSNEMKDKILKFLSMKEWVESFETKISVLWL